MHTWLNETLERISGRSTLAQAIRYACNHWSGLILFQEDGRLELDTNTVERASVRLLWEERMPCSPAPIVEANIGHWSQH